MKKLILITILASFMFAETHINGIEKDTTLVVFGQELSKEFTKIMKDSENRNKFIKATENRFRESKKSEVAQLKMKEKYPTPILKISENDSLSILDEKMNQAKKVRFYSNDYIARSYGYLDSETCKKATNIEQIICKYNKGKSDKSSKKMISAFEDLLDLEKVSFSKDAFCIRQILTLQNASAKNSVIADVTKELSILNMTNELPKVCKDAYTIATMR